MELSSLPTPWHSHGHPAPIRGSLGGARILTPVRNRKELSEHGRVATAVARQCDGDLFFLTPHDDGIRQVDPTAAPHEVESTLFDAETRSTADGRLLARQAGRMVGENDIDTLVLGASHDGSTVRRSPVERLATRAPCDAVVHNGRKLPETVSSVLLAFAGGPHSGVATDVAGSVAAAFDAWVDVLHVVETSATPERHARADELLDAATERLSHHDDVDRWKLEADDTTETLIEQSQYYDLLVLGVPTKNRLQRLIFGSTVRAVRNDGHCAVLMARDGTV